MIITISLDIKKICDNLWTKEVRPQMVFIDHRLTQIDTDCEPLVQIKIKIFFMLRDYQIEICERVREAFARHRSVMVQMPTGTGKTVVLAELVREYLNVNLNVNGGRNVLIVAHRRELVEQIQQALLKVMGAEDESSNSFGKYPSFRSLASKKGLVSERVFLPHPSSPARRGSSKIIPRPLLYP